MEISSFQDGFLEDVLTFKSSVRVGIIGATGAVGLEILSVLEKSQLSLGSVHCFASARSAGSQLPFKGESIAVETLSSQSFQGLDVALFCAGKKVSLEFAPHAVSQGVLVIDAGSAFRMDPTVPLVIPEINPQALKNHQGIIASPNCSTTIMLLPLFPLHQKVGIKRIVVATYQAASGAGKLAMEELKKETHAFLEGGTFKRTVLPHPYAFNLFVHNSPLGEGGYVEEELKMLHETRKILSDDSIHVNATCVRVPILRAHSEALNVSFHGPLSRADAYSILKEAPGVKVLEDFENHRFPMPTDASCHSSVFCGRIREDFSEKNTLGLWVVGDQLLKGAALNVVQILETLLKF